MEVLSGGVIVICRKEEQVKDIRMEVLSGGDLPPLEIENSRNQSSTGFRCHKNRY